MKKKLKKLSAFLLAAVMMLSMAVTVAADSDSATIRVSGLASDRLEVVAYQIVKNDSGSYVLVNDELKAIAQDYTAATPASSDVLAIAAAIKNDEAGTLTLTTMTADPDQIGSYTATVDTEGTWLVLVRGSDTVSTVYNPMIVSVYKDGDGNLVGGQVSGGTGSTYDLTTEADAYAKSSTPVFEKTIVDSGSYNDHGDDVAIGDTITYNITSSIPDYSKDYYDKVTYIITDQLDTGLDYNGNLTIYVGNVAVQDTSYVTITADPVGTAGGKFEISFDSDFILAHVGETVVVEFEAILNDDAEINFDPNTNDATLTYTNGYDEDGKETFYDDEDRTYHYTFGIDANLSGEYTESWRTHEVIKIQYEDGTVEYEYETVGDTQTRTYEYGMDGAVFQLLAADETGAATTTVVATATSEDGYLEFTGLDAGTYYLQETKPPTGYALDSTLHKVVISASYNENGTLKSYSITIDDYNTSTYEATYSQTTVDEITDIEVKSDKTTYIVNTRMGALPSTGGIGTTIFTVAGCVIMIAAAGLFFATRKKEQGN